MDNPLRYQASSDSATRSAPPMKSGTWKDFIHITKPGILRTNLIAVFGGFWLASQWDVNYGKMLLTLLGTVLIMASSCVFNNYFDRELDLKMERTRNRSLPTGRLTPKVVLSYAIILGVLGLSVLFSFSGVLAGLCGIFGMFVYVIMYTLWLKRSSTWSTSIGGLSGAMPPVIGYVAVTGRMDLGAWLLLAMLFLWQPPHFWALAIRRVEDYRAGGFPLLPVVKGIERTKLQMIPYLVLQIFVPVLMYAYGYAGIFYLTVSLILSVLWLYYALKGFRTQDTDAWAKKVFLYSINYLSLSFILMILDTVHK
ncbi:MULTISPECIES: heme o synthase [Paenibacillus]|uniref:Protoheme IX farnesyltransferase n=1 Tax=Paenibacillus pabuli TaxID=1472 RepID=A0A855XK64_9BACL|nr:MULTISPECIES: heme o synthase [Paenibacillus]PWW32889.1 protoheme IX farnesyltransferase [Paenibacillus pabuli]PXV98772.1 protoheme IX farnesyltransferase [Paenibacillus taichungensis]RAI96914.1 protoheme IX farnesyltransferase [Paenibacillus pabuli]